MKLDFLYSTDFLAMNAPELSHTCMHMLCTAGEGSFVFNEHCYHIVKNDLVVIPHPHRVKNLAAHPDMRVEWFAADNKYLQSLLPSNNYSIGGSISLNQNPVIKLDEGQAAIMLADFHRLRDRTAYIVRQLTDLLATGVSRTEREVSYYADRMNFASLSYFSRYCTKHLGMSPSEYRKSLQPKN